MLKNENWRSLSSRIIVSTLLYCTDVFTYISSRWARFYGSFFRAYSSEEYLCSVLTIISTFIVAFHNSMLIISTSFSSMHINEYKKLLFSYPLASYHVWRRTTTTTITTIIEELFVKNSVNYLLIYYTIFVLSSSFTKGISSSFNSTSAYTQP